MLNYPYIIKATSYSGSRMYWLWRNGTGDVLELTLTAPEWSGRDDFTEARTTLTGKLARRFSQLAPGDRVRILAHPRGGEVLPAIETVRIKRGHGNFLANNRTKRKKT